MQNVRTSWRTERWISLSTLSFLFWRALKEDAGFSSCSRKLWWWLWPSCEPIVQQCSAAFDHAKPKTRAAWLPTVPEASALFLPSGSLLVLGGPNGTALYLVHSCLCIKSDVLITQVHCSRRVIKIQSYFKGNWWGRGGIRHFLKIWIYFSLTAQHPESQH